MGIQNNYKKRGGLLRMKDKIFWLDGFEGKAKGGLYVRSEIAIELAEYEKKFGVKIAGLGIEKDYAGSNSERPSWNLELIVEEK